MSSDAIKAARPGQIILDSIAEGVFTVDLNFRVTSFNRAAEKITGMGRQQAVGKLCREVFRTSVCDNGCLLAQVIDTGQAIVNRPVEILGRDNRRIPVSVNAAVLKNGAGEVIGGVETFRDLTTEHRLRRALQRQPAFDDIVSKNEKMQRIFDILPRVAESGSTVLIQGACRSGAILAEASEERENALADFGYHVGMAFQMADDLLDYTATADQLGKNPGADLREGKLTLPLIYSLERAVPEDREWMTQMLTGAKFDPVRFDKLNFVPIRTISLALLTVTR